MRAWQMRVRVTSAFPFIRSPLLLHLFLAPEDAAVATRALGADGHARHGPHTFPDRVYGRCRVVTGTGPPLSLDQEAHVERVRGDGVIKSSSRFGQMLVVRDTLYARNAAAGPGADVAYTAHTDLVYYDAAAANASASPPRPASTTTTTPPPPTHGTDVTISDLDLFRFSALT